MFCLAEMDIHAHMHTQTHTAPELRPKMSKGHKKGLSKKRKEVYTAKKKKTGGTRSTSFIKIGSERDDVCSSKTFVKVL